MYIRKELHKNNYEFNLQFKWAEISKELANVLSK
jgi:hypothetical protein